MRKRGEWMKPTDDQILELLGDSELVLTPTVIAFNAGFNRSHVNRRLSEFVERGLVRRVERGKYEITDEGLGYLSGSVDASEL
ncbi:Winged helix-turn-helix [Halogranum gelatinilyticum]|uniref:Winged helix-turn-helix n=2 Tax=Halogranum gelatinilyticum TaxID=660521 RepID=A0A1G9X983_9EURY|nr:Winged helix-turn-helix [Halogranum gelatinilyticum]